ncbi:NAD(+) diphosphatase [Cognatilysobacter bugurensis]|uniref:NAD(+) diphosphatase n=1 Tax=Cognatilysobacter bugurensis TaxID=543356 RepID=A0A918SZ62_9GAMM|nr:NAD(+) diphosphatase [Lysobacter bugurensis]GHA80119.1 NADH pyrophosphatase [Lysobacter bugurensis]
MRAGDDASTAPAAPFAFVGEGGCAPVLDRAEHLRDDGAALDTLWHDARVLLLDSDGRALADGELAPQTPRGAELSRGRGGSGAATFLGLDRAGGAWFALDASGVAFEAPGRIDLRSAAAAWPALEAGVFAQARAMQAWRARHRFCGACGTQLDLLRGGWLAHCGGCRTEHYPRTDPAVIAAVTDGDRLLLGRQSTWAARRWSVLAGFVEPGESLEQTVVREVLEETGVRVRDCRYLASQPWPFPGALMLGFIAQAEADEPRVTGELEEARWFTADEVRAAQAREAIIDSADDDGGPLLSARISIARWLIERWLDEADRTPARALQPARAV